MLEELKKDILVKIPRIRITSLNSNDTNIENETIDGSNSADKHFIEDTAQRKWKGKGKGKSSSRKEKSSIEL